MKAAQSFLAAAALLLAWGYLSTWTSGPWADLGRAAILVVAVYELLDGFIHAVIEIAKALGRWLDIPDVDGGVLAVVAFLTGLWWLT